MAVEITDEDDKVTRLSFRNPGFVFAAVESEVLFADDFAMLTRLTYRIGDEVWHEHILHELCSGPGDDLPEAS